MIRQQQVRCPSCTSGRVRLETIHIQKNVQTRAEVGREWVSVHAEESGDLVLWMIMVWQCDTCLCTFERSYTTKDGAVVAQQSTTGDVLPPLPPRSRL